jgi:glycosyltransferase involved in cell wall biosynthesis
MLLSILIPTYNRAPFLKKNLMLLVEDIKKLKTENTIEFIISNNCSTDNTDEVVNEFIASNTSANVKYFKQEENLGLEKNALFVLSKSDAEYIMYLGDDDYIDYNYLTGVINYLIKDKDVHCIIPNFIPIDITGNQIRKGRDDNEITQVFSKGFRNCLINSFRGHQLSGLVLYREGLLDSYIEYKVSNIYLFIFFVGYRCLTGKTVLFVDFPVKVTQPGQDEKNWSYGDDGLVNEIFDNYKKLPLNNYEKTRLQLTQLRKQSWRIFMYKSLSFKAFMKAFFNVWFSPNSTIFFKFVFPFTFFTLKPLNKFERLIKKFKN